MEKFEFTPVKGFEDGSAYPNPSNEAEVRGQLMRPLYQLQEYINNFIEYLNSSEGIKEIGTANGSLADLLNDYVLKNDLTKDLKGKLDANLGADNKGLILYIDDKGNITPISIEKIGTALTEDVVMKYQGAEHKGKVLTVDEGGQVVPLMGAGGGSGPGGYYDVSVSGKVMEIKYMLTDESKGTDDGQGNGGTVVTGTGWTTEQINLFDSLLSHIQYTDTEGGTIANQLIESLRNGASSGGDDTGNTDTEETVNVTQNGSTLTIVSGVTASQSGSTLAIS